MPPNNDPLGLLGTTVADKYDVEAFVAEGGFSFVYRARHRVWQQPVALKFLRALQNATEEQKKRLLDDFVREGAFLRELSSRAASIVQAYDVGTMTGADKSWWPYLVLEWLDGASLDRVLEHEALHNLPPRSLPECVRLLDPAVRALAVAHRRAIAHRDLKPGNLFVVGDPRGPDAVVKLLDFGIAKTLGDATATATSAQTNLAVSPQFTPWYGAPEQFSRSFGATGPWTDVYALALVLVEMLTHRSPLVGDDLAQLAFASTDVGQRPTPREKGVAVSDAVEAVFYRAVALNPSDRYQNAGEFWRALYAALGPAVGPFTDEPSFVDASTGDRTAAVRYDAPTLPFSTSPSQPSLQAPSFTPNAAAVPVPPAPPPAAGRSRIAQGALAALLVGVAAASWGGVAFLRSHKPPAQQAASVEQPPPPAPAAPVEPCPPSMAVIPGGSFFMGYDGEEGLPFEKPAHKVGVSPFCMDVTEVTVEDYRRCSDSGECRRAAATVNWPNMTERQRKFYGPLCNIDDPGRDRHPINCVDWEMASTYCKVAGKRLPTSAEWEYAVRGPDGRIYPWGDAPPDANHLNACGTECLEWAKRTNDREIIREVTPMHNQDDGFPTTAPVGSFPKGRSRYGLDDVIGNVMEWVQDWDGPYEKSDPPPLDPAGPASGTARVLRGGAWNAGSSVWVRPSFRFRYPPDAKTHAIGFRCAAPAKGQKPAAGEAK